eukprot:GFUD01066822.1.p1 GENE.GFUD01066822.1~~GFUD01066822.1.p1  ORF type:complete len:362 (+),score=99.23 GFUD01066822.1:214-1299(+)
MRTTPLSLTLTTPTLLPPSPSWPGCVRLVCMSDTHGRHRELQVPPGDILIHSGDFTNTGTFSEAQDFDDWLGSLPHRHKVVVPGNHDSVMDQEVRELVRSGEVEVFSEEEVNKWRELEDDDDLLANAHVLINRGLELEGLTFFGSPHTMFNGVHDRSRYNRYAYSFGCTDESDIAEYVAQSDYQDCHVLVTHSPPLGIADVSSRSHRGSLAVRNAVFKMNPALHVFGHVHPYGGNVFKLENCQENKEKISALGCSDDWSWSRLKTTFVNAASLKVAGLSEYNNRPAPADIFRQPVVIDIRRDTKDVVASNKSSNYEKIHESSIQGSAVSQNSSKPNRTNDPGVKNSTNNQRVQKVNEVKRN